MMLITSQNLSCDVTYDVRRLLCDVDTHDDVINVTCDVGDGDDVTRHVASIQCIRLAPNMFQLSELSEST